MKRVNAKHIFAVLTIFFIAIYFAVLFYGNVYNCNILSEDDYATIDTWTLESDGSQIILPMRIEDTGEKVVLSKVLEYGDFEDIPYMMIMSKYYDYSIYLDDEHIYTYENPKNGFTKTNGAQIRIVRLGEDIKGKTLKMEITPLLGRTIKYSVTAPLIGSKTDIVWHSIKMEQPEVVADIFVILLGLAMIFLYFFVRRTNIGNNLFYLGLILVASGIYLGCQFRVSHIIASNSYMLYYVEFTALSILPLVVSAFIYINMTGKIKKICKVMCGILLANVVVQNVLNFVFGIEFRQLLGLTHFMVVLLGVLIAGIIILRRKVKEVQYMLVSFVPPFIGGILDLIITYVSINEKQIFFFPIGLYIFVAMQSVDACKKYMQINKNRMQSEIYEHLAFTDGLTGLYNRLAFENDINRRIDESNAACISIDLNNLKDANDTLGHSTGDMLIRGIAEILQEAIGDSGKIYRIGGDEFVVLIDDIDKLHMDILLNRIKECQDKYNDENEVPINFAMGISYRGVSDTSFEKMVLRADRVMYRNKREMKEMQEDENNE